MKRTSALCRRPMRWSYSRPSDSRLAAARIARRLPEKADAGRGARAVAAAAMLCLLLGRCSKSERWADRSNATLAERLRAVDQTDCKLSLRANGAQ